MTKYLPNIITLLRLPLTYIISLSILSERGRLFLPLILTSLVFLTDYADGKIARKLRVSSDFGALLDVFCDFFYIAVTYAILIRSDILPVSGLFLITFKLLEFFVTSVILKGVDSSGTLVFDPVGRIAAVCFYILPIVAYSAYCVFPHLNLFANGIILSLVAVLTFTSTAFRIYSCYKALNRYNENITRRYLWALPKDGMEK